MYSRMPNSLALRRTLSYARGNRKSKMAAAKPEIHVTLACEHDRIEIPKATNMYSRMPNSMALRRTFSYVRESWKSKIVAIEPEVYVSQLSAIELDILESMVVVFEISILSYLHSEIHLILV